MAGTRMPGRVTRPFIENSIMTTSILYSLPGCVQARRIARDAYMSGNRRRWRMAQLLMRNAMLVHIAQQEAA